MSGRSKNNIFNDTYTIINIIRVQNNHERRPRALKKNHIF